MWNQHTDHNQTFCHSFNYKARRAPWIKFLPLGFYNKIFIVWQLFFFVMPTHPPHTLYNLQLIRFCCLIKWKHHINSLWSVKREKGENFRTEKWVYIRIHTFHHSLSKYKAPKISIHFSYKNFGGKWKRNKKVQNKILFTNIYLLPRRLDRNCQTLSYTRGFIMGLYLN